MERKTYVHYGADKFDRNHPLSEPMWDKPAGLWASPVGAKWGWKDFCQSEKFHTERLDHSFSFQLKKGTKILTVRKPEDINDFLILRVRTGAQPESEGYYSYHRTEIDHEKLTRFYDGMELLMSEDRSRFRNNALFCTWDVDSIVLWNLDCIVPM